MTSNINIFVTSLLTSSERKVSTEWTLEAFKAKMELITGIPPASQQLRLYPYTNDDSNTEISSESLQKDDKSTRLNEFQIRPFVRIHVSDARPDSELHDLESFNEQDMEDAAFVLKEEDYEKKSNTVLQWKKEQKLGRFNPEFEARKQEAVQSSTSQAETMAVGMRCRIKATNPQELERRGCIRYIGKIKEIDEGAITWIGIELDEPVGKNNGSVKGTRYFVCGPNYGSFVKPLTVEVGDFPPDTLFSDSDEEL
ncbi:hypothetical protein BABINDRAFT_8069 [Babjeviella inositovora NRRL Y-12698]|uniref:CAP-Gly domain-containing protein n=1 Tax=Babjeviella inositovora NRRL Y-12698 TaxID=984486 RepID=A0A1E3QSG4_9ASCO|nr:uncharacterized protein BABINDRAFT_8069 [Babjeviella inositovora NRRL Y-12698]ODQ79877.1 hypothetical protein BABINDRAFT_8069 [Babjeviella inositovora NRRL Y-12698]